ncbi:uncharacterized protein LOC135490921 [Lineus longissimus]|uniref:uncharacterized protein LOC135490921 n=1 Tax=Lineus longissimus TaxID=88925 RepID=UPI00315DD996
MFTMCICELVKNLKLIGGKVRKVKDEEETKIFCVRFWERLNKFLEEECQDVGDKISGLELAWENLASNRQYLKECGEVQELFHILFLTCARVILSMEWENLPSDDPVRESFQAGLVKCEAKMVEFGHKEISLLNDLIKNKWSEPTLIKIMVGDEDVDEAEVGAYLHSLPHDILRLRLSLLMDGKCDEYALNLSSWMVRLKIFQQDVDILQKHLVLLLKQGMKDQFHKKCAKVACHTAVDIINCVRNQPEYKEDALILAQTFLGQDLFRPSYYCCTKSLLKIWAELQFEKDPDRETFIQSVLKMSKLARNSLQMTFFAEVLFDKYDDKFLELCTEFLVQACKADAVQFLFYKSGGAEFNPSGLRISLIHICHLLSGMYRQHKKLRQLLTLTAFSLDPSEELFKFVDLLHNVLSRDADSDAETDESASTIITADVDSDKGGKDAKEVKASAEQSEGASKSLKEPDPNTDKVPEPDSDKTLVKSDPSDNSSSQKEHGNEPMQTEQHNHTEKKPDTADETAVGILDQPNQKSSSSGETFIKSTDSPLTMNGGINDDLTCKEKLDESSSTNGLDDELECLPMCKKHGCCSPKTEKLLGCEGKSVDAIQVVDRVENIIDPSVKIVCQCDGKNITVDTADESNVDSRNGVDNLATGGGVRTDIKIDVDDDEPIDGTCAVFQRDDVEDAPEIVSGEVKTVTHGGANSGSFSASFEQWLMQNSSKNNIMAGSETPGEQTPTSAGGKTDESPSTNEVEEVTESSTSIENVTEDCSSATEIESVKDEDEQAGREGSCRQKRNASSKYISSRTRSSEKRKGSDDDSGSEKHGRGRRRKIVKYEEYCTDESESSTAESDPETEIEDDFHGVVVPGVNKKLLFDLLCICDRLRDDTLNPELPWDELRDRCLSMFGSGVVKQEPMEVKKEADEPKLPPVHFVEPEDVVKAAPTAVEIKRPESVVAISVAVSAAVVSPSVIAVKKVQQRRRKTDNASAGVDKAEKIKKLLPSGVELGAVGGWNHLSSGCVPAGMALELSNSSDKIMCPEEDVNPRAKWSTARPVKTSESSKQNVNDSVMVSRATSAFQKLDSSKRRPKILQNAWKPTQQMITADQGQVLSPPVVPYVPLIDEFSVPTPTTCLGTSVETPLVATLLSPQEVRSDKSGSVDMPYSVGHPVVTMASSVLRKPVVAAPAGIVGQRVVQSADSSGVVASVYQNSSNVTTPTRSIGERVVQVADSNGAIAPVYQNSSNLSYRTDTPSPTTEGTQFVALQGQGAQQQIVLLKSPAGQTVTYTASGGRVYKIWNSKNYSRYNLGQGQRIVGIQPLVRTPSPDEGEVTSSSSLISQSVATGNSVVTLTQASPSITPTRPVVAMNVPQTQSTANFDAAQIQNLASCMSTVQSPPMSVAHSQPFAVVNPQPVTVPQTRLLSVPLSAAQIQSMNIAANRPVSITQTLPTCVAQTQQAGRSITIAPQPLPVTPTHSSNISWVQSPVSGSAIMPSRNGNVPVSAGRNPKQQGVGIAYAGSYPVTDMNSESDIVNHIWKQTVSSKVVQRTSQSVNVNHPVSPKNQSSPGTGPRVQTVKDMLHQVQNQQSLVQQRAANAQFSNVDARIRSMLQNAVVKAAGQDGQVLIARSVASQQYAANAVLQAAQIAGIKPTTVSNMAVQTHSSTANNTATQGQIPGMKTIPSNQLLMRQALQNQQRYVPVPNKGIHDSAMFQNRTSHANVQPKNQEIIVLSDSDSDSDYRRKNERRMTYSKKDREPVLSVLAKTLSEKLPIDQLHSQLSSSSSYSPQQMASLVANSRTLMDQVVRGTGTTSATTMNQINRQDCPRPSANPRPSVAGQGRGRGQTKSVAPKKVPPQQGLSVLKLPLQGQAPFAVGGKNSEQLQNAGFSLDILSKMEGVSSTSDGVAWTQTHKTGLSTSSVRTISVPGIVPAASPNNRPNALINTQHRPVSPVPQGQSVYLGSNDSTSSRILVVNDSPMLNASIPIPVMSLAPSRSELQNSSSH